MPSSGARSGTTPNRPAPAGDGRVGADRGLRCGHRIPVAAQPTVVRANGRKVYTCPSCGDLQEPVR